MANVTQDVYFFIPGHHPDRNSMYLHHLRLPIQRISPPYLGVHQDSVSDHCVGYIGALASRGRLALVSSSFVALRTNLHVHMRRGWLTFWGSQRLSGNDKTRIVNGEADPPPCSSVFITVFSAYVSVCSMVRTSR